MIVIKLSGGLGNQMFGYAVAKHLALRNRTILKMDLTFLKRRRASMRHTPREYMLGMFALEPRFFSPVEHLLHKLKLDRLKTCRESDFQTRPGQTASFNEDVLALPDNTYLEGVFPLPRYFAEVAAVIRQDFAFRSPAAGVVAEQIAAVNAVGVHVRRGDYVTNPSANQTHGLCPVSYYHSAVARLRSLGVASPHFFVFSDDIPWCRENLRFDAPMTFVEEEHAGENGENHFKLLTGCRHFIICNSTFSWWTAWLSSTAPEKVVVAPRRWKRQDAGFNPVPEGWETIDAELVGSVGG